MIYIFEVVEFGIFLRFALSFFLPAFLLLSIFISLFINSTNMQDSINPENLYVPASSRSSRDDIDTSSYNTTPEQTPESKSPPISGQSTYYKLDDAVAGKGMYSWEGRPRGSNNDNNDMATQHSCLINNYNNYKYVPTSSRTSRHDIESSSYHTTPCRSPRENSIASARAGEAYGYRKGGDDNNNNNNNHDTGGKFLMKADYSMTNNRPVGSAVAHGACKDPSMHDQDHLSEEDRHSVSSRRSFEAVDAALEELREDARE